MKENKGCQWKGRTENYHCDRDVVKNTEYCPRHTKKESVKEKQDGWEKLESALNDMGIILDKQTERIVSIFRKVRKEAYQEGVESVRESLYAEGAYELGRKDESGRIEEAFEKSQGDMIHKDPFGINDIEYFERRTVLSIIQGK